MATTADILGHHLQSFGKGDLDGILSDYTDDSVVITPDGTVLKGPAQIGPVFKGMFEEFGKPGMRFDMGVTSVEGEVAFITWNAETADNTYELGTDTFVVRDGKIAYQTFAAKVTPKR